jgi:hypothetical protein
MKKNLLFKQFVLLVAVCSGVTVSSQTVTVSNCNLNGWTVFTANTGTVSFVNGPQNPPLTVGSVQYSLTDGNGKAALVIPVPMVPLGSLTTLSYATYITANNGATAPALELAIDYTGDGTPDDRLVFEPVYQNGTFGVAQPAIQLNIWQTWNALNGGWWADSDPTSGPATYTLTSYLAAHPTSVIVGMTLTTGGGTTWNNFVGNADALRVGIAGTTTTYNFEPCEEENGKKLTVCHDGKTITIGKSALEAHLKHGDQIGACATSSRMTTNGSDNNAAKYNVSNFPNPFNGTTRIQFNLPYNSNVSIKVFDISGREVATILNTQKKAGSYTVPFNASKLKEGIYYYNITVQSDKGNFAQTKSMKVIK